MSEHEQTNECPQAYKISLYHDGELPANVSEQFSRHLSACPLCSAELGHLEKLSGMFSDFAQQEMPAESRERLYGLANRAGSGSIIRLGEVLSAIAAGILILCMVGLTQQGQASPANASLTVDDVVADGLASSVQVESEDPLANWVVQDLSAGVSQ